MKTIYRYEINDAVNTIKMPNHAEILSVGVSDSKVYEDIDDEIPEFGKHLVTKEKICLWALVETENTPLDRKFLVFGTGADMSATETYNLKFIGTVKKKNQYAFHIFETNIKK